MKPDERQGVEQRGERHDRILMGHYAPSSPRLRQPENSVEIAFAWPAQVAQAVDDRRLEPDQPLALVVDLGLDGDVMGWPLCFQEVSNLFRILWHKLTKLNG
jgi:hypothetical protein